MSKFIRNFFNSKEMKNLFINKIFYNSSVGIDKVKATKFMNRLTLNIKLIQKKMDNKTYNFTPYKEILISKGRDKKPRVISVPTVRDRLVLQKINIYLQEKYIKFGKFKLSQTIISELIKQIKTKRYDSYIKMDLSNFYGTINHSLLLQFLQKRKISKQIIEIIHKAINTPTVSAVSMKKNRETMNEKGVPQGLSISNVLASFYMIDLDRNFEKKKNLFYVRYVDDILILCNKQDIDIIFHEASDYLTKKLLLDVNTEKCDKGYINDGFSFLGYRLENDSLLPRVMAIRGLERTIEKIFIDYSKSKDKNYEYFIWKLNLKITGAISENKKYGWLFYFSQITDESVFFHLDWFIQKMIKRFGIGIVDSSIRLKKYVRAYKEITQNLKNTKYIPNFDLYDPTDMEKFLIEICKVEPGKDVDEIIQNFKTVVFKSLSSLEKDLQTFS